MPGMSDLIIYQKMYDYMLYAFPIISRFPKQQRYVLGQRIETVMMEIAERIVQANKSRNKRPVLFEIDILLEKLKLLIRLAKDLGMMSTRAQELKRVNEALARIEAEEQRAAAEKAKAATEKGREVKK